MAFYQFKRVLKINAGVEEVWDFISSPANLKEITPRYMGFDVTTEDLADKMYEGQVISYRVSPLWGIPTTWVTEITHVKDLQYFVDEQRVGPYKLWHHQHFIEKLGTGTLMTDIVSYVPPLGFLGRVANKLVISSKLSEIFDFRSKILVDRFGNYDDL